MKLLVFAQMHLTERIEQMRGPQRDRGDQAFAWVLIAAVSALIVAAVYAAINGKVLEKMGIIEGA